MNEGEAPGRQDYAVYTHRLGNSSRRKRKMDYITWVLLPLDITMLAHELSIAFAGLKSILFSISFISSYFMQSFFYLFLFFYHLFWKKKKSVHLALSWTVLQLNHDNRHFTTRSEYDYFHLWSVLVATTFWWEKSLGRKRYARRVKGREKRAGRGVGRGVTQVSDREPLNSSHVIFEYLPS